MRKYVLSINNKEYNAEVKNISTESAIIIVDNKEYKIDLKDIGRQAKSPIKSIDKSPIETTGKNKEVIPKAPGSGNGVPAPLPGLIVDILVKENTNVKSGQTIAIMEAMKMENQIQAPHDGSISKIFVNKGDSVAEGDIILEIERSVMTSL